MQYKVRIDGSGELFVSNAFEQFSKNNKNLSLKYD